MLQALNQLVRSAIEVHSPPLRPFRRVRRYGQLNRLAAELGVGEGEWDEQFGRRDLADRPL